MGDYCTKEQLRQHLGFRPEFVEDDAQLTAAIVAAEAAIEDYCGRAFTLDAANSDRIYEGAAAIAVDDIADPSAATVYTSGDRVTWTATSAIYFWDTDGSVAGSVGAGAPATVLTFRDGAPATYIKVTAAHGWSAVPAPLTAATKLVAAQLLSRRHSPNGIEAFGDFGSVRVSRYMDSQATLLLKPYRRASSFVGVA